MSEILIRDISIFASQGKEALIKSVSKTKTIEKAGGKFIDALDKIRKEHPEMKIYYVIGTVTSDGPEFIERNLGILKSISENVGHKLNKSVVFSAADIFNDKLFRRFNSHGAVNQDYLNFWDKVISSGCIEGIVRAPGWERSAGASHESNTAHSKKLIIHDYSVLMQN